MPIPEDLTSVPEPAVAEALIEAFIERKRRLYPEDDRLVMDVRFESGDRSLVASVSGSR